MQVEGMDHADRVILQRVRDVVGDTPLGASYDLHANITPSQLELLDIAIGYKCHPHTDMAETAAKAVDALIGYAMSGRRPVFAYRRLPSFIPSINARTTDGPMAEAMAYARGVAQRPELIDVSIYQGYAYGDRSHAGGSVLVYAGHGQETIAEATADSVLAETLRVYPRLFVAMPDAREGVAEAVRRIDSGSRPIAVIDAADHPGAGTNADTPGMLRAVLDQARGHNVVFAFFWDPQTVAEAESAGPGATIDVGLGARLTSDFGPSIPVRARVDCITDGRITHVGPFQKGLSYDYGRTCMLSVGSVRIIVTAKCLTVSDPAFFALHGIDLADIDLLAVKAKNQFRAAFAHSFAALIDIDEPGPAAYDFSRLPFRNVPPERRRMAEPR
jgi:microcystin degradation protein MlrC